jgi:hypothetical protein
MRATIKFIKCILFAIFSTLLFPSLAMADTYQLSAGWTDSTPTGPNYTPAYNVEYRINGGASVPTNDLTTPAFTATITAAPGQNVEVRVQNKNTQGPLLSAWSAWANATAPAGPTQPTDPSGVTVTITRIGP